MKRFAVRSKKFRIGILIVLALGGFAAVQGITEQRQFEAQVANTQRSVDSPAQKIDVSEKQKISVTKTEVVITEEEVPFPTTQTYDGTLEKDTRAVRVEGRNGKKVIKTEVKTKDGVETSRALISEDITVPPVAEIVAIGTKVAERPLKKHPQVECDPNYKPCIPYVRRGLSCDSIGFRIEIIGEDRHKLDGENKDGIACER